MSTVLNGGLGSGGGDGGCGVGGSGGLGGFGSLEAVAAHTGASSQLDEALQGTRIVAVDMRIA